MAWVNEPCYQHCWVWSELPLYRHYCQCKHDISVTMLSHCWMENIMSYLCIISVLYIIYMYLFLCKWCSYMFSNAACHLQQTNKVFFIHYTWGTNLVFGFATAALPPCEQSFGWWHVADWPLILLLWSSSNGTHVLAAATLCPPLFPNRPTNVRARAIDRMFRWPARHSVITLQSNLMQSPVQVMSC